MRKEFKKFLIETKHLPEFSVSGARSTSADYPWRISHICNKIEKIGWETLCLTINEILPQYEMGGEKFGIGKQSHTSFIQALRYFREFSVMLKQPQQSKTRRKWFW